MSLPPMVVQLEGSAWTDADVAELREELGLPVMRATVVADGGGANELLKMMAKVTLTDLKAFVSARASRA